MGRYSITLNIPIPDNIISKVKKIKFLENSEFDWRASRMFHCTLKAIEVRGDFPSKKEIREMLVKSSKILKSQFQFEIQLIGIGKFPNVIYTRCVSKEILELHKKLCSTGLPSNRPEFEGDDYIPHASMIMLKKPSKRKYNSSKFIGKFIVKEIQLIIWDIQNNHKPSVLRTFKLKPERD